MFIINTELNETNRNRLQENLNKEWPNRDFEVSVENGETRVVCDLMKRTDDDAFLLMSFMYIKVDHFLVGWFGGQDFDVKITYLD